MTEAATRLPVPTWPVSKTPALTAGLSREDIDRLLAAWASGKSERTRETYAAGMEAFRRFLDVTSVEEGCRRILSLSHGQANLMGLEFQKWLTEKGLGPGSVNLRLAALRSMVSLAQMIGLIPWSLQIKRLKSEVWRDTSGPSQRKLGLIFDRANQRKDPLGKRNYCILRLLFDLALRRKEIVTLDIGHVDLADHTIWVLRKGKQQRTRWVLARKTKEALADWLAVRHELAPEGSQALFVNADPKRKRGKAGDARLTAEGLRRMVQEAGLAVGIMGLAPHKFRHSSTNVALELGYNVRDTMQHTGHRSLSSVQSYLDRLENKQQEISEAVSQIA